MQGNIIPSKGPFHQTFHRYWRDYWRRVPSLGNSQKENDLSGAHLTDKYEDLCRVILVQGLLSLPVGVEIAMALGDLKVFLRVRSAGKGFDSESSALAACFAVVCCLFIPAGGGSGKGSSL